MSSISLILGLVLGVLIGYTLGIDRPTLALVVTIVLVLAIYLVYNAMVIRTMRLGNVLFDEMHVGVAEKAGLQAFRVTMIIGALILIVVSWSSYFSVYVVPYEVAERLYPGLCLGLAILSISYTAFYVYYIKSKKIIE